MGSLRSSEINQRQADRELVTELWRLVEGITFERDAVTAGIIG